MPKEVRSKGETITFTLSNSLKGKFKRRCKDIEKSFSQHLRDLIQQDLKEAKEQEYTEGEIIS